MHFKKSEISQNHFNFVNCPFVDCPTLIVSIECAGEVWCLMTSGWSLMFNDVSKYLPFFIVKVKQEATWKLGYLGYSSDTFRRFISLVFSYWRRFVGYWLLVMGYWRLLGENTTYPSGFFFFFFLVTPLVTPGPLIFICRLIILCWL